MKKSVLFVILSFFAFSAYAQDVVSEIKEIKYTEVKSPEVSNVLAKVHAINAFGFKGHLIKTFVINNDLGYTKDETPQGAKQSLYISDSELGKEITTKLFKTDSLVNLEVLEVVEAEGGFEIKVAHGLNEDRIEQTFTLKLPLKK